MRPANLAENRAGQGENDRRVLSGYSKLYKLKENIEKVLPTSVNLCYTGDV